MGARALGLSRLIESRSSGAKVGGYGGRQLCPVLPIDPKKLGPIRHGHLFGYDRGGGHIHQGVDLFADLGTAVRSPLPGKVEVVSDNRPPFRGYGNTIVILHNPNSGLRTMYAHLSEINVKEGQRVEGGQKIGEIGASGTARRTPHLHWEVSRYSYKNPAEAQMREKRGLPSRIDPLKWLAQWGMTTDGKTWSFPDGCDGNTFSMASAPAPYWERGLHEGVPEEFMPKARTNGIEDTQRLSISRKGASVGWAFVIIAPFAFQAVGKKR